MGTLEGGHHRAVNCRYRTRSRWAAPASPTRWQPHVHSTGCWNREYPELLEISITILCNVYDEETLAVLA